MEIHISKLFHGRLHVRVYIKLPVRKCAAAVYVCVCSQLLFHLSFSFSRKGVSSVHTARFIPGTLIMMNTENKYLHVKREDNHEPSLLMKNLINWSSSRTHKAQAHTQACTHTHTHTHSHILYHTLSHTHTHTHTHTLPHTFTQKHTHTHTHTHCCVFALCCYTQDNSGIEKVAQLNTH